MKSFILILGFIFLTFFVFSQETAYFETKRDYIFKALYIDSVGDTITNEKLIIRIPDRRWIGQPRVQKSMVYIYDADTADLKSYVDPDSYQNSRNQKYFIKNGRPRYSNKETTGGYQNDQVFYMHPPRRNQYKMLFYSVHPEFYSRVLEKGTDTIPLNMIIYGVGYLDQKYIFREIGKKEFFGCSVNLYQVNVNSYLVTEKERFKQKIDFYSSTFDALFTYEYGFTKMHYEFKSGVKIQFDLIEVRENNANSNEK